MRIEIINTDSGFDSLRDSWERLTDNTPNYGIFNSFDCNRLWWKHHQHLGELSIFVAIENEQVIGIAPLYRHTSRRFGFLTLNTLSFIGRGASTTPDDLDLIVDASNATHTLKALCQAVFADPDIKRIHLRDVPLTSKTPDIITSFLADNPGHKKSSTVRSGPTQTRLYEDLPADWQTYLSAQSRNFRKQVKRRNNRLQRTGTARFPLCKTPDEIAATFDALVELHHSRWDSKSQTDDHTGSESFTESSYLSFHRDLTDTLGQKDRLWLQRFELDGQLIGVEYAFSYNNRLYLFQTGFLPEYNHLAPGHLMMSQLIEKAITAGIKEIDLLKGDYEYKQSYAGKRRESLDIEILRGPLVKTISRVFTNRT